MRVEDEASKTLYKFFGHSPTQLRNRHCVFYSTDLEKRYNTTQRNTTLKKAMQAQTTLSPYEQLISRFGKFNMKNVAKKASRIGLLLSTAKPVVSINDTQVDRIADVENDKFNFTDGCGLISPDIAAQITGYPFQYQYEQQVHKFPSVYQIRFKGCKGILMLDTTLVNKIALRQSMIKFEWNSEKTVNPLRIVEDGNAVSFPNVYSCINLQFIRLLSALGVPDEAFLTKLGTYFEELSRIMHDQEVQVRFLCAYKRYDPVSYTHLTLPTNREV